ncbi:hypothetical protein [Pseudacidovorax intermedius]|uniref:gp53-like domain-containing protein n=1 Tax=Pseudacidovorax intermedius TaxID=433924 RepID=UPI0026EBFE19|nr:hypothetical protein [Pseudacidovorax intermedius]
MERISTPTAVEDAAGPGRKGFVDGNLALGRPPTAFSAAWCNTLQEELAGPIEASGLTLDPANRLQLLAALSRPGVFQTPGVSDSSTRPATTAFVRAVNAGLLAANGYQKLPSGLIMQWGISGVVAAGSFAAITLPIAFPNAGLASLATWQQDSVGSGGNVVASGWPTTTTITVYNWAVSESVIRWLALGY